MAWDEVGAQPPDHYEGFYQSIRDLLVPANTDTSLEDPLVFYDYEYHQKKSRRSVWRGCDKCLANDGLTSFLLSHDYALMFCVGASSFSSSLGSSRGSPAIRHVDGRKAKGLFAGSPLPLRRRR